VEPSKDEVEDQPKGAEEEDFQGVVHDEDFEVFYRLDMTVVTTTTSTSVFVAISANKEADQVPEGMVIEKRVPDLLSLLESHTSDATSEIPVVPRPPSPTPPQIDPVDKKRKRDKKARKGVVEEGMI